ncbi:MAG: LacI family DNA-binding transcriptional regulator [Candidatus Marinimicrobia bacterium]|nr:LacI family DNA-binding transcriptional regulator [Candidatus Neomarinimicrobiota bacterium]
MGITIKDIAKIAGVSTSTVSLVISRKGYVSKTTRNRIQKIIDEYNYRPLRSARQLASNQTGNIGFIISDVHLSRSEAFYSRILLGVELEARNYDINVLLSTVGGGLQIPQHIPRFLRGRDVDGIIIAGSIPEELIHYIYDESIPLVLIDYKLSDLQIDVMMMDNRHGIQQVVEHLVKQGIEHIGFVGGSHYHPSIKERFEGYQIAMDQNGLGNFARAKEYYYLVEHETSSEIGIKGTQTILKNRPDIQAIVCANDTTAIGCLQELQKKKIRIPDDIAVVGFDDNYYAAISHPTLSSVHVPKIEMGFEATKLLMNRIANPNKIYQTRTVPVKLVVRESSQKNHV